MTRTVEEIAALISQASDAYYNSGDALMEDSEFDALVEELRFLDPKHPVLKKVGAPPLGTTYPHTNPIGSQEKLKTREELNRWCEKVFAARAEACDEEACPTCDGPAWYSGENEVCKDPIHTRKAFVLQWKLDGLTVVLSYKDGKLTRALTRGDGERGEDVTRNVSMMQNVKKKLVTGFTGSLRGEALINISTFKEHFKDDKNPRNTIAGKTRNSTAPKDVISHCRVCFFDYVVEDNGYAPMTEIDARDSMKMIGLESVETWECATADEIWAKFEELKAVRPTLDFEVDGIIVRANSIAVQKSMGMSADLRPKGQRCVKFEAVSGYTTLESCEMSLGHTGAVFPTGKVKPLGLGGVTISSVFLNNFEEIERLGVQIGDEVEIIRAGDVIPKVLSAKRRYRCPECKFEGTKEQQEDYHKE